MGRAREKAQSLLFGHSPAPSQGLRASRHQLHSVDCEGILAEIITSHQPTQQQSRSEHCSLHHSAGGGIAALRFYRRAEIGTHLRLIALGQCLNINQGVGGISVKELQCLIHTRYMELFRQVTLVNFQIFNTADKSNSALSVGSAGI